MWNAPCVTHASARPFPAPSTQTPEGVACPRDHRPQNPPPGTFPQGPRPRDHPGAWFPPWRGWEHTGAEKPPAQGRHRCEVTRKEATPRTCTRLARITAHKDKFQGCSILEEKKLRPKTGDAALLKLHGGVHTTRRRRRPARPTPRLPRSVGLTPVKHRGGCLRASWGGRLRASWGGRTRPVQQHVHQRQGLAPGKPGARRHQRPLSYTSTDTELTTRQFKTCDALETRERGNRSS